jgi:hypothetical protein
MTARTNPLPYVEMNWHNGFATSEAKNAKHFGGWQISEENAGVALGHFGKLYPLFGETEQWMKGKGEGTYPARSTRFITAAPIATRVKWYDGRDGKNGSSKTQILVYLCEIDKEKNITPYAPALIHGGSYHAGVAVTAAFQAWSNHINTNREAANIGSVPAWAFWGYFGTFGDKRTTKEVGTKEKNFIVPCQVNFPKDPASIRSLYVGDVVAAEIMVLRKQAQAWLDDAKSAKKSQAEQGNDIPQPEEDLPDFMR